MSKRPLSLLLAHPLKCEELRDPQGLKAETTVLMELTGLIYLLLLLLDGSRAQLILKEKNMSSGKEKFLLLLLPEFNSICLSIR